jgi:hypothetical protein
MDGRPYLPALGVRSYGQTLEFFNGKPAQRPREYLFLVMHYAQKGLPLEADGVGDMERFADTGDLILRSSLEVSNSRFLSKLDKCLYSLKYLLNLASVKDPNHPTGPSAHR